MQTRTRNSIPQRQILAAEQAAARRNLQPVTQPGRQIIADDANVSYNNRMPSSTRRYRTAPPKNAYVEEEIEEVEEQIIYPQTGASRGGLITRGLFVGIGMGMVLAAVFYFGVPFLHTKVDEWRYGKQPTTSISCQVFSSDTELMPTTIIISNKDRHLVITIEPGNGSNWQKLDGPTLYQNGGDTLPVFPQCMDFLGNGFLGVGLQIDNNLVPFLVNPDGKTLRSPKNTDRIQQQ